MKGMTPCPSDEILAGLLAGTIPEPGRKDLQAHLAACPDCGTLWGGLEAAWEEAPATGDDVLARRILASVPALRRPGAGMPAFGGRSLAAAGLLAAALIPGILWESGCVGAPPSGAALAPATGSQASARDPEACYRAGDSVRILKTAWGL